MTPQQEDEALAEEFLREKGVEGSYNKQVRSEAFLAGRASMREENERFRKALEKIAKRPLIFVDGENPAPNLFVNDEAAEIARAAITPPTEQRGER